MSLSDSEDNDNKDFPCCSSIELHIPYSTFIIQKTNNYVEESLNLEKNDYEKSLNLFLNTTQKTTKDFSNEKDYSKELINEKKTVIQNKEIFEENNPLKCINLPKLKEEIKKMGKKEKCKCGRKRIRKEENLCEHNKFSDDNVRRKCKHLLLKSLLDFLNEKIKMKYNGKIGKGIFKKKLRILNQSQTSNATVEFNQKFLKKKLYEIFSESITGRFTSVPSEHNKMIITKLLNDEDINMRMFFRELFELDFIQCLKHFRGEQHIEILKGLKCFDEYKEEIMEKFQEDGNDYLETLNYYLNNYETIIYKKKPRKSRK